MPRVGALGSGRRSDPSAPLRAEICESSPQVSVLIVTYNSAADLPACFAAIAQQSHRPLDVVVVDCDSRDDGVELAETLPLGDLPRTVRALGRNLGFAGGMNAALALTDAEYVLALNADACPEPEFVQRLVDRARAYPSAAAVTGRLLRPGRDGSEARLDACGMVLTRTWRHLDRGSGQLDEGQFSQPERVFGATGAATLYRRSALEDVAIPSNTAGEEPTEDESTQDEPGAGDEIFDTLFHSYREDAELCFRFQERGWDVLYEPSAVAEHRRRVVPKGRAALPAAINFHSLKNRYLLRAYHQTGGNALRTAIPTVWRDLLAIGWVLLRERSSLPAYGWLWRHRREILRRRQAIQGRKTHASRVERWFNQRALPLPKNDPTAPADRRLSSDPRNTTYD